eukprot:tig00000741_g3833.t1
MALQSLSWQSFLKHHLGEWIGRWDVYDAESDWACSQTQKVITRFEPTSEDVNAVKHDTLFVINEKQDYREVSEGVWMPWTLRQTCVDNTFSWSTEHAGTTSVEAGFREGDWRLRVVVNYSTATRLLTSVIVVRERLKHWLLADLMEEAGPWLGGTVSEKELDDFESWHRGLLTVADPELQSIRDGGACTFKGFEQFGVANKLLFLEGRAWVSAPGAIPDGPLTEPLTVAVGWWLHRKTMAAVVRTVTGYEQLANNAFASLHVERYG